VYFDVSKNTYTVFMDTHNPASQSWSTNDSTIVVDTLEGDTRLVSCTYTNGCVVFTSTGAASTSGDLKLVTADGSTLMSINALASTGRVRVTEVGS
jgi:hypothetical protein